MSRTRGRLVPSRLSGTVRARTESAMDSTVRIVRGQLGELDPATGTVAGLENAKVIYGGANGAKARIRTISGAPVAVGEGYVQVRRTMISIPSDAVPPHVDDLVLVVSAPADADLSTRILRVSDVQGGGLFGDARRFEAEGWYQSRYWGQQ